MTQKYFTLIFCAMLLVFTSCVSKKKYLEMESGRLKAEQLSKQLSEENTIKAARIEALIADFESMKNELLENNAIKDNYIDSLNGEIFILAESLNVQKESLQETSFNLDFEKERLTNALNAKDKSIKSLQTKVERLETEVSNVSTVVDQKNFEIGKLEDKAKVLEGKIQTGDNRLVELQAELEKVKAETVKLQDEMKMKDAAITKLENNVKLLKKEIGG
jgi:chromosome segregation ATPase